MWNSKTERNLERKERPSCRISPNACRFDDWNLPCIYSHGVEQNLIPCWIPLATTRWLFNAMLTIFSFIYLFILFFSCFVFIFSASRIEISCSILILIFFSCNINLLLFFQSNTSVYIFNLSKKNQSNQNLKFILQIL